MQGAVNSQVLLGVSGGGSCVAVGSVVGVRAGVVSGAGVGFCFFAFFEVGDGVEEVLRFRGGIFFLFFLSFPLLVGWYRIDGGLDLRSGEQ